MTSDRENDPRAEFEATMRMLWQPSARPARGPRPKLSREQIVETAIELADEVGLEAMSMRAVARALGVGTMSLYRYVPSKVVLVDLMFDTVLSRQPRADELPGGWRAKLEAVARTDLAFYLRHPWILDISSTRPPLGPGTLDVFESLLRAVDGSGLTKAELSPAVSTLAAYVRGAAYGELTKARAERDSGLTDEQWWTDRNDFWERYFDPERYPTITSVYAAGGYADAPDEFEFGLQRLLDGLQALIDSRRGRRRRRTRR
jgi:AcrR family transcriptional regulator